MGGFGTDVQKMTADILVADDDEDIRRLVENKLRAELGREYEIVAEEDGESAWEYLKENSDDPPELAVLDVMMPNLDGFSVLERMREEEEFDGVQVVILTSRSREEDVSRALEAGADDFIAKPFSPKELVGKIRRML